MTIAAGFLCRDGVVLAADSQYTTLHTTVGAKTVGPKIFTASERSDLAAVIAGAGSVPFIKRSVEDLTRLFASSRAKDVQELKDDVETALKSFYNTHILYIPVNSRPDFRLLIGLRFGSEYHLWESAFGTVTALGVGTYACLGVGDVISEYAINIAYLPDSVSQAKLAAAFGIKAAKDHIDGCGGNTNIRVISNSGVEQVSRSEITPMEDFSTELYSWLSTMLHYSEIDDVEDEDVGGLTEALKEAVLEFRGKRREYRDRIRKTRERAAQRGAKQPQP